MSSRTRCGTAWVRAAAVICAASAALTAVALHRPGRLVADPDDPSSAVVGAAAWAAWLLVGYLLAGVAVTATAHLCAGARTPSRRTRLAARVTPRVVRRLVDAAVGAGAGVVIATAVGPAAAYADGAPTPAAVTATLDWPGLAPASRQPVVAPANRTDIVVRAGDTLWTLTARQLGPGASAAEVAATWPRLYAANRAVIGADPGLIHPGQRLVPPAAETRSPR